MAAVLSIQPQAASPFTSPSCAARKVEARCTECNVRSLCLPSGIRPEELEQVQNIVAVRRRIKSGETLFRAGDAFTSIYAVRWGTFKTSLVHGVGREQVTAFVMGGELFGIAGMASGRHGATAVALEDSEVCVMPYTLLEMMAREYPALARRMNTALSREIVRARDMMMLLGSMRAEERLAAFLSNLSRRFAACGQSRYEFHLRMSREDIGSHLGLTLETVSRLCSQFQADGLIAVKLKHVRILDMAGLERIAGVA